MTQLNFKQGEAKTVTFTVNDGGSTVDLSGCTVFFGVKSVKTNVAYIFSHDDGDFDKTNEDTGIVTLFITAANTNQTPGTYYGELRITFPGSPAPIDKSQDINVVIEQAVIPV